MMWVLVQMVMEAGPLGQREKGRDMIVVGLGGCGREGRYVTGRWRWEVKICVEKTRDEGVGCVGVEKGKGKEMGAVGERAFF